MLKTARKSLKTKVFNARHSIIIYDEQNISKIFYHPINMRRFLKLQTFSENSFKRISRNK